MEVDVNSETHSGGNNPPETQARIGERGFTLVETAIALVVMMVMALGSVSLFTFAIKFDTGANDRAIALAIAQQRMERLRRTSFSDSAFDTPTLTEFYTVAGHPYSVVTTVCSTSDCGGSPMLKLITVRVTPSAPSNQWSGTPATIITKRSAPVVGAYLQ
jgi:Tfp pilus assembly protein PilV